jgi:branched-chain amino acid transport system substrate-binding protein
MRAELRVAGACLACALAFLAAGCGGGERVFRIGVLSDCRGLLAGNNEPSLAGAEFPLLVHGARLRGAAPSDGITTARAAGRRVELVIGCSESGVYDVLVAETRRLIDVEHVDAVVGGLGAYDSLVLRELARHYPAVSFVLATSDQREATAANAAPNVYRFEPDDAQQVAGLGTYAYRQLGWRRAAIVADDYSWGWAQAEAFAGEFCALGGRIVSRLDLFPYNPKTQDPRRVPVSGVDGAAVFVTPFGGSSKFVRELARREGAPEKRLVLGPWITLDPIFRRDVGVSAEGAVAAAPFPAAATSPALEADQARFRRLFPKSGIDYGGVPTRGYANAVTALLSGLEKAGGNLSRLQAALASTTVGDPDRARLDRNRQAIVDAHIVRLVSPPGGGKLLGLQPVRTIANVDESFGGLLPATPTSASSAVCRTGRAAPWAR